MTAPADKPSHQGRATHGKQGKSENAESQRCAHIHTTPRTTERHQKKQRERRNNDDCDQSTIEELPSEIAVVHSPQHKRDAGSGCQAVEAENEAKTLGNVWRGMRQSTKDWAQQERRN